MEDNPIDPFATGIHSLGESWQAFMLEETRLAQEEGLFNEIKCEDRVTQFSWEDKELYGLFPILKPFVGYKCLQMNGSRNDEACGLVTVAEGLESHAEEHRCSELGIDSSLRLPSVRNKPQNIAEPAPSALSWFNGTPYPDASTYCPVAASSVVSVSTRPRDPGVTPEVPKVSPATPSVEPVCTLFPLEPIIKEASDAEDTYSDAPADPLEMKQLDEHKPNIPLIYEKFPLLMKLDSLHVTSSMIPVIKGEFPLKIEAIMRERDEMSSGDEQIDEELLKAILSILPQAVCYKSRNERYILSLFHEESAEENATPLKPANIYKNSLQERKNYRLHHALKTIYVRPQTMDQYNSLQKTHK